MTRSAHLDLFCGASGDMLLGGLIDAGVPEDAIRNAIAALGLEQIEIGITRVVKRGIAATKVHVTAPHEHVHRHLPDIEAIIGCAALTERIRTRASAVFRTLAVAEAQVHGIGINEVHFHEVGALDAIADIVGVVAGFEQLDVTSITCRGLPISHGTVKCDHGLLPVPAPAVLRLMAGLPTYPLDIDGETVTPTAAALLRTLVTQWGPAPAMRLLSQGYGAGSKDFPRANVLRLLIGERDAATAAEHQAQLALLATNLDDMNPEWLPPLIERLLAHGALDAWLTPILMKKGRPAHTLSVLCAPADSAALRALIYRHTTTLGVRESLVQRSSLSREIRRVATPWGTVGIKIARLPDGQEKAAPEHEDCSRVSSAHNVSLAQVYDAALSAWREGRYTSST